MAKQVDILLATYEGEPFIEELMDSLFSQTFSDFRLLIRDDLSKDGTLEIIKRYQEKYPDRITIISSTCRVGACLSFNALLLASKAPYIMFCDQDDVWHRDKIECTLRKIQEKELCLGVNTPLLVHTDLRLTDKQGNEIAPSFWRFAYLTAMRSTKFSNYLVQNNVTGCTTICNRALVTLASPIPKEAIMHDWWMALVASAFGEVVPVNKVKIDYRQHGNNTLGAIKFDFNKSLKQKFFKTKKKDLRKRRQFNVFYERYSHLLSAKVAEISDAFRIIPTASYIRTRYLIIKHSLFPNGILRAIAMLLKHRCFE